MTIFENNMDVQGDLGMYHQDTLDLSKLEPGCLAGESVERGGRTIYLNFVIRFDGPGVVDGGRDVKQGDDTDRPLYGRDSECQC